MTKVNRGSGLGVSPKSKMSAEAAMPKHSFFQCVRTLDLLAILPNPRNPRFQYSPVYWTYSVIYWKKTVREVSEDGFPEPKRKPFTYIDDEYQTRSIRRSHSYYEYAKDICTNYRMDLRRYKRIRERKQFIGVDSKEDYRAMCEDMCFIQQSIKTVLKDYAGLFQKRFSEGLSVRKAADVMQLNRGAVKRRQAALHEAFSLLLEQRDEADGVKRIAPDTSDFSYPDDMENE